MSKTRQEEQQPSIDEQILTELKRISRVLLLTNGQKLESELEKYASTSERKKAWTLIDGKREVATLIEASGLKKRSIYDFLDALERANLIERSHGSPPSKTIDYVPASWAELLKSMPLSTQAEESVAATATGSEKSGDAATG